MYKTGNPCSECPANTVCSQQYPGLCQSNGAEGQLPVIVTEISPNVPTNTLDQMRPSTPIGTQWARKFKKVQGKKLAKSNKSIFFREIAFLNFFPVQKLIFGHFEIA